MSVSVRFNQAGIAEVLGEGILFSRKLASATAEQAKVNAPKRSGRLAASIHVATTKDGANVVAGAEYATKIEERRPFLAPALAKALQDAR